MAAPLNRIPPGLLEYFGVKAGEWGPRELGQTLQPVLELGRWYLDSTALQLQATIAGSPWVADLGGTTVEVTATGPVDITTAATLRVPPGESWLVLEASLSWQQSDTSFGQFWWISGDTASGFQAWPQRQVGYPMTPLGASAIARIGSTQLASPFWVPAGHLIRVQVAAIDFTAGSVFITSATLRLQRFKF